MKDAKCGCRLAQKSPDRMRTTETVRKDTYFTLRIISKILNTAIKYQIRSLLHWKNTMQDKKYYEKFNKKIICFECRYFFISEVSFGMARRPYLIYYRSRALGFQLLFDVCTCLSPAHNDTVPHKQPATRATTAYTVNIRPN